MQFFDNTARAAHSDAASKQTSENSFEKGMNITSVDSSKCTFLIKVVNTLEGLINAVPKCSSKGTELFLLTDTFLPIGKKICFM